MKKIKTAFLLWALILLLLGGCKDDLSDIDFRQEMRNFVQEISEYAKEKNPAFVIIPQNGAQLVVNNEDNLDENLAYINAIDGQGQEDLFYGYDGDDEPTPEDVTAYLSEFLNILKSHGKVVLVTDYCYTHSKMDDSYAKNSEAGFVGFAAPDRNLSVIPDYPEKPYNVNSADIQQFNDVKNFLYLINPENFSSVDDFINAIKQTDYDLVLIDLFFDGQQLTSEQVEQLKVKANGGKRLVIAYMSIGEAEDYRYYWKDEWKKDPPEWLENENPAWKGNYKVRYWYDDWKKIIFGSQDAYLDKILASGFDGVYLDIIDAFEYFEEKYD